MKRTLLALALSLFVAAGMLVAQELAGRIEGSVMDPTGAVIPGAAVTATHVGTGTVYRASTNAAGRFIIPRVRLGRYDITVETQGFSRALITGILVEVGSTASLKVALEIGAITEEVVVEGSTSQQIINTVNAELSTVIDERRVLELPLNGRNASHLVFTQAGVYFERNPDGPGTKLFVHGQRHRSLNITLDGIDTQDNLNRASSIMLDQPLLALAAENIQEFKVATGNTTAEYSRGGAQISAVTRSGGNEWHGSLFEFHRNDVLNANAFFNNTIGTPTAKLIRNQFGGRVGGPIFKDKTFFFFGYEQTRESKGIPANRTVYTAEARQGLFRYLDNLRVTPENVAANPGLIRTVNLLECSAAVLAAIGQECVDDRFDAANPTSLDPFINGTVFAAIPLPNNFDLGDGLNTGAFRFNSASRTFQHLPAFRLDHILSEKHALAATFNYVDRNIEGDFINNRETIFPALGPLGSRVTHSRGFGAVLTSTFSPTIVNEGRFGVVLGENAFFRNQPFGTPFTLDFVNFTDPYSPGGGTSSRDNETWHLRDSVSWVKGNHELKFGGEFRHRYVNNFSFFEVAAGANAFGEIDFDDNDNPPGFSESDLRALSTGGAVTDIESADMERARDMMNELVGAISEVETTFNVTSLTSGFVQGAPETRIYRDREVDLFFNDNWKIHPKLTLNLGLRWEFVTVPVETQGLVLLPDPDLGEDAVFGISGRAGFFNPGVFAGKPCAALAALPVTRTTANAVNFINSCSTRMDVTDRKLYDNDYNNFGPVIGLAWDPWGDGKSAVRAGYRISYMQDVFSIIDSNTDDNEGLQVDQDCIPLDGTCQNNPLLLRDLLSTGPAIAPVPVFQLPAIRSLLDSSSQDFRTYVDDLATAYYQEWNLSLSREFLPNTVFEIRYVGNRGLKLRRVADFNEMNINALDPVTGMTFLDAYLIAQSNLACNRSAGAGNDFSSTSAGVAAGCITVNPLIDDLIAGDPGRLDSSSSLLDALDLNQPGDFIDELTFDRTSRPASGESRIRGGSWWGAVLAGRFPANFFLANPFVASARRMTNDGFSTFHSLEIEARRRMSRGLMFQVQYTFGKALADFDGDQNTLINDTRPSSILNSRSTIQQYIPRHQFKANWINELPFGPGKPFAPQNALARKLLEGWQTGGVVNFRSGRPLKITSGLGMFHRQAVSDENTVNLAQQLSNSELRDLTGLQNIGAGLFWLDPSLSVTIVAGDCVDPAGASALFQCPNPGQLGQLSQTPIYGPIRFDFDFSLMKRTQVTETIDVEFRWEVFNLTNTTNFNIPNTDILSTSFGQITRTVGNPRLMQFALKLNF